MTLLRAAAALPLAAALAAAPARAQAGSLEVKVTDPAGLPLAGVEARVDGVVRGATGTDGRVKVRGLAPGWHGLKVASAGRQSLALGVLLPPGGQAWLEVGMERPRPAVALPRLDVIARKHGAASPHGTADETGTGRRWTKEDIARAQPRRLSDILAAAPGVEIVEGPAGAVLRFRRAFAAREGAPGRVGLAPPDCAPAWYVDGVRFDGVETADLFPPSEVEEVVLYAGNVPGPYGGMRASCGVVLIRTRGHPVAPSKPVARPGYARPAWAKRLAAPSSGKQRPFADWKRRSSPR